MSTFSIQTGLPRNLIPLFTDTHPPKMMWVQKKGEKEFKQIPVIQFAEECKFTWTESLLVEQNSIFDTDRVDVAIKSEVSRNNEKLLKNYFNNIDQLTSQFGLRHQDDMGYYLVAKEELKEESAIPYLGVVGMKGRCKGGDHSFQSIFRVKDRREESNVSTAIQAEYFGNIARFMPHLPTLEELKDLDLPANINKNDIATSLDAFVGIYQGKCITFLKIPSQGLPKGCPMGFSYGPEYWGGKPFWLLNKSGEKVALVKYNNEGKLELANPRNQELRVNHTDQVATRQDQAPPAPATKPPAVK